MLRVEIGHTDVQQEVVAAGEDEDAEHLGHLRRRRLERVDDGPAQRPHLHGNHRLHAAVERDRVDLGVVPPDHVPAGKRADPFQAGRRRDAEPPGELPVGQPSI